MKTALVILSIVLVIQISEGVDVEKDSYTVMKEMAANMKVMIKAVIKDMPTTPAYHKYKEDWENVLKKYDERKDGENCADKINRIIQAFGSVIRNYLKRNPNVQETEMLKLFNQHGFEYFTDKYGSMLRNARDPANEIRETC